ncbi:hypothetical protein CRENBAI_009943 [Crenichthys baileyi]|uniref:Immunoglobulin domain-containing protein n=1 Tax=Crenichthys baileyi TaxID=28760 RepID=A0AAV9SJ26_9TELE
MWVKVRLELDFADCKGLEGKSPVDQKLKDHIWSCLELAAVTTFEHKIELLHQLVVQLAAAAAGILLLPLEKCPASIEVSSKAGPGFLQSAVYQQPGGGQVSLPSSETYSIFRNLLMDLLWMVLLTTLVCSEAQNMLNVTGELGQDVNLTCSINHNDIYWFMEIHNQLRIGIGRTFSSRSSCNNYEDFKSKFSMSGNRLVIRNVSAEDSRLYFCGRKENGAVVLVDQIRLTSGVRPAGPTTSSTPSGPNMSTLSGPVAGQTEPAVLGSFTLNAVLFVLVLALTCVHFKRKGCCCCSMKDSVEYSLDQQEMQNPQQQLNQPDHVGTFSLMSSSRCSFTATNYGDDLIPSAFKLLAADYEEIQLPPPLVPSECIYSKAQHPGYMPQH